MLQNVCYKIKLKSIIDRRGVLVQVQNISDIPFAIKRIFYIYDVPKNKKRGSHAHKKQSQFLICIKGELKINIKIYKKNKVFNLCNPNEGLYIPPRVWLENINFSNKGNSILLVLTNGNFTENDYIRNYSDYLEFIKKNNII
jgi:dTDP-4-dehydrorhamnose 3,5-epimerase-like enzyme